MSDKALRLVGRWAIFFVICTALIILGTSFQAVTSYDVRYVVGWLSCGVYYWMFPSAKP